MNTIPQLTGTAALQALPEALVILDQHYIVQFINRAACRLLNVTAPAVVGMTVTALPGGQGWMTRKQHIASYNTANEYALHQVPWSCMDALEWSIDVNARFFNLYARPIVNGPEQAPIGFVIRIDEYTEERTARSLLSDLIFELYAPLTSIRTYLDLLLRNAVGHLTQNQYDRLTAVQTQVMQLIALRQTIIEQRQQRNHMGSDRTP